MEGSVSLCGIRYPSLKNSRGREKYKHFKGQTRLPKYAVPKRYDLTLKPDLSACTFTGAVEIDIHIIQETKFLVLNALQLLVDEVWFRSSQQQEYRPWDVVVDDDNEILVLAFDDVLALGDGVLGIKFSGILNDIMKGFYRGTYVVGGEKKNMASTQFEAVDARRCFPCWDEPAIKSTFKITVEVPSQLTTLSNMPVIDEKLNGHLKTIYFMESPVMSTYLVAIVVGSFDYIEATTDGIKVRVYCPVGKSDKGKFALDVAVKALDLFKKYFSMPYTLPKLDMVAIPDFAGGAMENYGLITYREIELLHDELHSAAVNKQRVSYLATDSLFPEWNIWAQFLEQNIGGLQLDALEGSHPIEVEVHHARSVDEIFDAISYKKGCAVIRMLQDYIGADIFQRSLASYMKRYAGKNARTEDLWRVLSEESGVQVDAMMDTWTKQKGYPVISVKSKDHILDFEQSQFLSSGSHGDGQWIVPITLSIGSYNTRKNFLLETKLRRLDTSELLGYSDSNASSVEKMNQDKQNNEQLWVKLNVEQAGFYRVKYDDTLTARLRKAIKDNYLSAPDRFGILDDSYALCEAGKISLSSLLSLMDVYRKELDYTVLSRLINISYNVTKISIDALPNAFDELKQIFTNLLLFSAE
ncbi:hypothetical protein HHK36_021828 [Tetracentron sinense]|uniref:Alpha-aminoacylpeptide hydrolase n=1 Tax=Tetracentron sinense TaxID=13715 RepID=A0A834YQH2_TETSI|nr:hypothetical protein HHK36_021828 [Tetracentron sinense]